MFFLLQHQAPKFNPKANSGESYPQPPARTGQPKRGRPWPGNGMASFPSSFSPGTTTRWPKQKNLRSWNEVAFLEVYYEVHFGHISQVIPAKPAHNKRHQQRRGRSLSHTSPMRGWGGGSRAFPFSHAHAPAPPSLSPSRHDARRTDVHAGILCCARIVAIAVSNGRVSKTAVASHA